MFIISRLLLGLGIPFSVIAASSLIGGKVVGALKPIDSGHSLPGTELSHPKERARLGSIFTASWYFGATVVASVTLGTFSRNDTWSWRIPSVLQLLPSAIQLTFIWWIPESPRWLISKGRREEAMAILVKYHAEGSVHRNSALQCYQVLIRNAETKTQNSSRPSLSRSSRHSRSKRPMLRGVGRRWWRPPVCASVSWSLLSWV